MKQFMLRSLMLLSVLLSSLGISDAWAQLTELEVGKVYHFKNARYENYAMGVNAKGEVRGVTPVNKSDCNQLWIVAEKNASGLYRLQSLGHGGYLQAKGQDTEWLLVDANTTTDTYLVLDKTGTNNVFRGANYGTYGYANVASGHSYKILGWTHNNDLGSQWTIEKQELDEATLNNALDNRVNTNSAIRTAVETALANLFTDAACTTKKKSITAAQLDTDDDYKALTPTLQKMAKKVYGSSWEENNFNNTKLAWGASYAKKYRVQWYEPYTEPECAAKALRINAHTNLNNPTGIFANNGDLLFVMVEGEIKEGAYLYLASYTGHGKLSGYASGVELHQGLNVIPVSADGTNYCINYVVKTFDASKGTGKNAIVEGRELSKYPDLQIHIEGGCINGYWNKMGDAATHNGDFNYTADTDADWDYIKARATQTDVTILGEYVTLQFPLTDEGTVDDKGMASLFNSYNNGTTTVTTSLKASIDEWDKVMIWERLLMGVVGEDVINDEDVKSPYSNHPKVTAYTGRDADLSFDYSEYYRVHGLSFGTEGGYMYGSWDHCGYNFSTMPSIMVSMVNESGPHWGPAHEIGHQHQGPLNMRGLTEVTNNLFSNVVLWYYGKSTARYNGTDGALSNVLAQFNAEGTDFFSNNIWAQTIMYYKLFLYYHVLGYNPKFYPRLFELLRQNPMTIEYEQDGGKCLMHFYKLCCDAAGEDLTEFFRAHGFFEVMEERFVGDYSNAVYNITQAQIDQAIADVKTHNYPQNLSVLFITDATGEGNIESNRGDDVYLTHYDTNKSGNLISGELGNYATFKTVTAPNYNYSISGNTVTMEGSGGVGFAILNEKGELIGFSDKKTFEISQETMEAISNGEATIAVMPASGEPVPAVSTMSESDIERTLLADLIEQAETMVALIDDEGKKIGFYKSSYTTELESSLTKAQEVYENREENAYTPAFNALKAVMDDLKSKAYAKIAMKAGVYTLRNQAYPARYMSVNASNKLITTANAELTDAEKWTFEQGNGQGHYYIKSVSTGKYINALEKSKEVNATTTEILDAKEWLVEDLGNGVFGITCQDDNNQSIHCDAGHKIVGWNTGATASRWYLTALETEALSAEQQALEELIVLSEDMLKRVATIETATEGFELDANSYYCNAPMTANWYGDGFKGYHVLFDEDYSTYLHTDYTGKDSEDGLDHYLRVDLGENNSASLFTFYYATRNSSKQNPTAIVVEGSNTADGEYEVIANLTREADKLIAGAESEYVSAVLGQSNKSYRYLRFRVTATVSGENKGPEDGKKYIFFVFSEFGVSKAICSVTPLAKYSTLTSDYVTEVFNKIREAKYVYANADKAAKYTAAKEALQPYYNTLLDVYNTQESTALDAKKEALQTLINQATALIDECGSVAYTEATTPQLNITEAPYKLSDNNGASKGSLDKLYDGLQGEANSYTSDWSATPTEPSYLQVDLGTDNESEELIFTFTNRNEGNAPTPTEIVVSASSDGKEFTVLDTFTSAESNWPPAANGYNIAATKWTSPVIQASSACRYWRFTVTESDRSSGKETNSKGIYHFGISEFGIVIPARLNVTVKPGMGEVTEELLLDTYKETQEAISTKNFATTEAQVDRAIVQLEDQYNALSEAKNNFAKSELKAAIDLAQTAIDACASSITQENGNYIVEWNFDKAGDVDKATLIAAYEAVINANSVYESTSSTVADYQTTLTALSAPIATLNEYRSGYHKAQLSSMIVTVNALISKCQEESLGDLTNGMFEDIVQRRDAANGYLTQEFATHEELVNTITSAISYFEQNYDSWSTAQQSSAKAELRTVIARLTELIAQCGVVEFVSDTEDDEAHYVATLDPYAGVVTEEQLIAAYTANVEANTLADNSADAKELTAKKNALQDVYNTLLSAKNTDWLPVTLTTDVNTPVLYTFKSLRGDTKALQYDPADAHSFCITDAIDGVAKQAFFFMMGDTRNQVYIYPYAGAGMVLGANNTGNGANKVFAGEKGSQTNEQWIFTERTVNDATWYDLKPVGQNTYFSNFGGGSNNMGFYGSADDGSGFQFVETSVEGSVAYNSLKLYYDEAVKVKNTPLIGGDGVGYYPEGQAKVYNTAYTEATEKLSTAEATSEEYLNAYCALRSANEALVMNMPADGYYIIQSVVKDNGTALAYANFTDNKMYWGRGKTAVNAEAIWKFSDNGDGTYTVSNMHTGTLINGFIYNEPSPLHPTTTGTVTLQSLAPDGQIGIYSNGIMMHAQSGGEIVRWNTGANDASAWRVIEVDLEAVSYPLTITQFGYAGLHLNYPVEIPEGVTAYTIYEAEGANGVARMQPIDGGIIPANTGVIIKGNQGDYTFDYAEYNGGELNNLLSGSNYTRYVKAEANTDYFVFAAKKQSDNSYKVGLYITWEECDANGSTDVKDAEGNVTGSNKGTHNGGYFKSSANKIFLACDEHEVAGVQKFFFSTDEALTDIDAFLNGCSETTEIYDLQGRRVTKVTKNGVYIVNGEKQFIKVTKL